MDNWALADPDPEGKGCKGSGPPGKSQLAIGFQSNFGTDPFEKHWTQGGPQGGQLLL